MSPKVSGVDGGAVVICKGKFKVKATHPLSSWLAVTVGLHFHAMCGF